MIHKQWCPAQQAHPSIHTPIHLLLTWVDALLVGRVLLHRHLSIDKCPNLIHLVKLHNAIQHWQNTGTYSCLPIRINQYVKKTPKYSRNNEIATWYLGFSDTKNNKTKWAQWAERMCQYGNQSVTAGGRTKDHSNLCAEVLNLLLKQLLYEWMSTLTAHCESEFMWKVTIYICLVTAWVWKKSWKFRSNLNVKPFFFSVSEWLIIIEWKMFIHTTAWKLQRPAQLKLCRKSRQKVWGVGLLKSNR